MIEVKVTQTNEVEEQMAADIAILVAHTADLEKQATKLRGECRNRRLSYEDLLASSNADIEYLGNVARDYRERAESFETEKLRAEQKLSDVTKERNNLVGDLSQKLYEIGRLKKDRNDAVDALRVAVDNLTKERNERHAEVADVICTERKHTAEVAKTRDLAIARVQELFNDVHHLGVSLAESERVRSSWVKYAGEQAVLLEKKDEMIALYEKRNAEANERTEKAIKIAEELSRIADRRNDALNAMGIFLGETFICTPAK